MQTIVLRIGNIFSDAEKEAALFINDLVNEIIIILNSKLPPTRFN
jgi:hypothetical protein